MLDLSKNVNPYYPKKNMINFLKRQVNMIYNYPPKHVGFKDEDVQQVFQVGKDNVMVTSGTMDAIDLILRTLNKKTVGYIKPTFWGISHLAIKNNYKIIEEELDDNFEYDVNKLNKLAKKVDILYICNSNNPTLSYIDKDNLYNLIEDNPKCQFIIDETILMFDENYQEKTVTKYVNELSNLNVLVSCSKIFGVCGLRVGLLFTSSENKKIYNEKQVVYSTNVFASEFIEKNIHEFNKLNKSRKKIKANFEYFENMVQKKLNYDIISKIISKNGSFILVEVNEKIYYDDLVQYLLNNGIKIFAVNHHYEGFYKKYLRISAGKKQEFKKLIHLLQKYKDKC